MLSPDLLVAGLGKALWKKVRRGELQPAEAHETAEAFVSDRPVTMRATASLLHAAVEIATLWQQTIYDSLYIAVALAEGYPLQPMSTWSSPSKEQSSAPHLVARPEFPSPS